MTQTEFASKFGLPAVVVSNWEQGRNTPDTAARVLLAVIDRHPEAVEDTLQIFAVPADAAGTPVYVNCQEKLQLAAESKGSGSHRYLKSETPQ